MRFVPFTTIKYNAHVNPNEFGTWQGAWVATETYLDIEKVESVAKVETFDDARRYHYTPHLRDPHYYG